MRLLVNGVVYWLVEFLRNNLSRKCEDHYLGDATKRHEILHKLIVQVTLPHRILFRRN